MLLRTSSTLQSHPCSPLPSRHPQLLGAVPSNKSPWHQGDHATLVLSPWRSAAPVTSQTPWRTNFPTLSVCDGFWWLRSPSEWSRKCRSPHLGSACLSLAPSSGMEIWRQRNFHPLWTESHTGSGSRLKRDKLHSGWRWRWMSRACELRQMHPFLEEMCWMLKTKQLIEKSQYMMMNKCLLLRFFNFEVQLLSHTFNSISTLKFSQVFQLSNIHLLGVHLVKIPSL